MKLLHRGETIGLIKHIQSDGFGFAANIELLPAAEPFKSLFSFLIDEERNNQEPPFNDEILEGWSIIDEQGIDHRIFAPAIDDNYKTIEWRWCE